MRRCTTMAKGRRFVPSLTGLTDDGAGACGRRFMRSFAGLTDDGAGERPRQFVRSCMGLPVEMLLACVLHAGLWSCGSLRDRVRRECATSTEGVCHVYWELFHAKLRVSAEYGYVRCDKGMCTAKSRVPAGCVYALCQGRVLYRRVVCLRNSWPSRGA